MQFWFWVLCLAWLGLCKVDAVQSRQRELSTNEASDNVPSLSLFIPPPQLVSIVSEGVTKAQKNATTETTPHRQKLIVDPLLALLDDEEARLLEVLLPELFNNSTHTAIRKPDVISSKESLQKTTTTSNPLITTLDPILDWLFNGKNDSTAVTEPPKPTSASLLSITDDMILTMLKKAIDSTPTTTQPTTTEETSWTRPVGIGDDLLVTLLKTLQKQPDQVVATEPNLDTVLNNEPASTTSATTSVTAVPFLSDENLLKLLTTVDPDLSWPEKVKPGGGISEDAIAAIIKDVNEINKNVSEAIADLTADFPIDKPVTLSDDSVAQIIHDVGMMATSTEKSAEDGENETKVTAEKAKKKTKAKSSGSGKRPGSSNANKLKKKPSRKPSRSRPSTKRPNLWERLVKAASNALFGSDKPNKGLFQVDDILDLLTNL